MTIVFLGSVLGSPFFEKLPFERTDSSRLHWLWLRSLRSIAARGGGSSGTPSEHRGPCPHGQPSAHMNLGFRV